VSELEAARDRWVSAAEAFAAGRPEAEPGWIAALRREALGHFEASGLPGRRREEWRYTNVEPIARGGYAPAEPGHASLDRGELQQVAFPVFACSLFVFVNGRFEPELSSRVGSGELRVESLARALQQEPGLGESLGLVDTKAHPFAALNTAFLEDGACLRVPEGANVAQPFHLVFVSMPNGRPTLTQPRVLVCAERGSRACVIQDHVTIGEGAGFTNAVAEIRLAQGAALDFVLLQRENEQHHHVSSLVCQQERDSRLSAHTLTLGGSLVRNDLATVFGGEGAEARLDGLFVGAGEQLIDNHTLVDHAVPHCTSDELYKGILGGRARGVFRGRVLVRPDAQKTDARQSNPNVLLGDGAEIDTKPQLEIHADDVRCSHGASIGRLDPEALFYLRARGIEAGAARELLTRGFAAQILERLPSKALAESVSEILVERLTGAGGAT
jgi:Fe-S cluster assembly protein SufD